jgi:hypothetical protein
LARKIIVLSDDGLPTRQLVESLARDEAQLQETVKANPDLLPVDDFGMHGPLLVVGRETTLPSGAVDLVAVARSGELLIVEFKTGPANPDFRAVLAQLLDYGSDLWGMSFEEFEQTVAARYFASSHCTTAEFNGLTSFDGAARRAWTGLTDDEGQAIRDSIVQQLRTGAFHYIAVAQRFAPSVLRTIEYLNASMQRGRFYAVELVRFAGAGISAFEARTLLKAEPSRGESRGETIDESQFLESIPDPEYREALQSFLDFCHGFGVLVYRGTAGMSLRVPSVGSGPLLSVGWLFPPGKSGWMGLRDTTFGYDEATASRYPSLRVRLDTYVADPGRIPEAEPLNKRGLKGSVLKPAAFVRRMNDVKGAIERLVLSVNEDDNQGDSRKD